jgi:ABC-type dipeptide/oligopeptide/nickel transport system permease component
LVQAGVLILAFMVVLLNASLDLTYTLIDPRLKAS